VGPSAITESVVVGPSAITESVVVGPSAITESVVVVVDVTLVVSVLAFVSLPVYSINNTQHITITITNIIKIQAMIDKLYAHNKNSINVCIINNNKL